MIQIPIGIQNTPHNNKMLGDLLKVFTVAVVREIITSSIAKTPTFSKKWVDMTFITLFGFLVYYLVVSKNVTFTLNNVQQKQQ
jgi:hypothetical protein